MASLSPYHGTTAKLVLAFDVGITQSGISYSILKPGQVSDLKGVAKFPSQDATCGSFKVASVLYYDDQGVVRAVGAETQSEGICERAEKKGWNRTEWFKMHLRPRLIRDRDDPFRSLPLLPVELTAVQVFGDYLKYLLACSKAYLEETQPDGGTLWASLEPTMEFVISYPNDWGILQQSHIYSATVYAGLIPNNATGQRKVSLVTEGEASFRFALHRGLLKNVVMEEEGVVIVDAGGRTTNISVYVRRANSPTCYESISTAVYRQGSICVSDNLRMFLKGFLAGSRYIEDIEHIVKCFDEGTKLRFRNSQEEQFIKFGRSTISDLDFKIRFGQLKLHGSDIAACFGPPLKCIVDAIKEIRDHASIAVRLVILVGGFSANDWLYESINQAMGPLGVSVLRPDKLGGKSVSEGALAVILDRCARRE